MLVSVYAGLLPGACVLRAAPARPRPDAGARRRRPLEGARPAGPGTAGARSAVRAGRPGRAAGDRRQARRDRAATGHRCDASRGSTCACASTASACVPACAPGRASACQASLRRRWMRVFDFDRKQGDGRAYVGTRRADLAAWSPLLQLAGVGGESGQGRAEAWADLARPSHHRGRRSMRRSSASACAARRWPAARVPRVRLRRVSRRRARWRLDGRRLACRRTAAAHRQRRHAQKLDGLAAGRRQALTRCSPIASMPVRCSPRPRSATASSQGCATGCTTRTPQAFAAKHRSGRRARRCDARACAHRRRSVSPRSAMRPACPGWPASSTAMPTASRFAFDPDSTLRFDWPRGFGVVTPSLCRAWSVAGAKAPAGASARRRCASRARASACRHAVACGGRATARGRGSTSPPRSTRPGIPVAKGFWIRHKMPPRAVEWLDIGAGRRRPAQRSCGRVRRSGRLAVPRPQRTVRGRPRNSTTP